MSDGDACASYDRTGTRDYRRGKSSQTRQRARLETLVNFVDAVTCTCARRHACWKEKNGVVGTSGWVSGSIVHASGWVGSLLKCKPGVFFEGWQHSGMRNAEGARDA